MPSFKYVFKWRLLQEKKLRIESKGNKTMLDNEVKNFIMFYERLTKHMIKTLSYKADSVIKIDNKQSLSVKEEKLKEKLIVVKKMTLFQKLLILTLINNKKI